jgi:hypothetical protein
VVGRIVEVRLCGAPIARGPWRRGVTQAQACVCWGVQVGQRRWKVDTNARQDAILMLSSINLPGGIQRRKSEADALHMRQFYVEGDLLSVCRTHTFARTDTHTHTRARPDAGLHPDAQAKVETFFQDGAMSLHTRSGKYGKVRMGLCRRTPCYADIGSRWGVRLASSSTARWWWFRPR